MIIALEPRVDLEMDVHVTTAITNIPNPRNKRNHPSTAGIGIALIIPTPMRIADSKTMHVPNPIPIIPAVPGPKIAEKTLIDGR